MKSLNIYKFALFYKNKGKVRIYFFLWIFVLFPEIVFAQKDTAYIQSFKQNLAVSVKLNKSYLSLTQKTSTGIYDYLPNNPIKGGIGLSIRNTWIDFSLGQEFNFMRDKKRGKTKAFDFQVHHYGVGYVLDLYIQKYRGFYVEDKNEKLIGLCPELEICQYGLQGQYVFNHQKFSYKAAFPQSEKQLRTAGSGLLGGCVYFTDMIADSAFLANEGRTLHNFQFGINGGYTRTWVFKPHWFVNASLVLGVNIGNEKIKHFGRRKIEVYPSAFPRIAVGYNRDHWALGVIGLTNITFLSTVRKRQTNLFAGHVQVSYIQRFHFSRKPFRIRRKN